MRSAFAIAAFAAGAIAVPFAENKRALEYDYEVQYVTNIVTVTAYGAAPTPAKAPHYGHKPTTTKAAVVPVTTTAAPKYEAPVYEAPVYEAPASSSSAPSTEAPSAGSPPTDYKSAVIYSHNLHRANHSAPALEWDTELEDCARITAQTCKYEHDVTVNGGGYGQNIAAGVAENNITAVISDMFYNGEEPLYAPFYGQEPDMTNFHLWGHFTQIVWKDTTHVACYTQACDILENTGGGVSPYFTVCNYKSPGNYAGEYAANVLAPKGEATADWSASSY